MSNQRDLFRFAARRSQTYLQRRRFFKIDGTLTYRTDEVHGGYRFVQPTLGPDGIEIAEYCYASANDQIDTYVNHDGSMLDPEFDYVKVVRADSIFRFARWDILLVKEIKGAGVIRSIPATIENLKALIKLPLLEEGTYYRACELINQWEYIIPYIAFFGVMMKAGAQLVDPSGEDVHRIPTVSKKKTFVKTRQPTPDEAMLMAMGHQVDLSETVTVDEREAFEAAVAFDEYCISFGLFSQQMIASWAIIHAKTIALWMDMRTGKTAAATCAAKFLHDAGLIDHVLVVCPVTNMYDPWGPWLEDEGFDVRILDGTKEEDYIACHEATDVRDTGAAPMAYVINFERVRNRYDYMLDAWDMSRVMIIADETSAIKNPKSRRSMAMHELCRHPEYVVLLNGTPMEQGPQDLWSQMRCLDTYGCKWDRDFGTFAHKWLEIYAPGKYVVKARLQMDFEMLISMGSIRYIRAEADQHAGKDKTFRHVSLTPTQKIYEQTRNIAEGFLETIRGDTGERVVENMTPVVIRTYGFWRETACGYDKYRVEEEGPYERTRHEIDPKLLWIQCFMAANPTQPLVIYVEFNEQEQRLKELLDELGIKWSSTRPLMRKVIKHRLLETIPVSVWVKIRAKFGEGQSERAQTVRSVFVPPNSKDVHLLSILSHDEEIVRYVESYEVSGRTYPRISYTERYTTYKDLGPYGPSERARQIADFNVGSSHVFILKWAQGRGISLARKEAVAKGIGTYPAIVSCAPPWSLGNWDQGQDRCVCTDPRTNANVNTMVYSLAIRGTIEYKILSALRQKKQVQADLLKDIERNGYESFVENMLEDMRNAMSGTSGTSDESEYFDSEEMHARIVLGVPPYSRLTETLIRNKAKAHKKIREMIKCDMGNTTNDSVERWFAGLPREAKATGNIYDERVEIALAWDLLKGRVA